MSEKNYDDQITMLPDRLNRIPVVFKGMSINELLLLAGIGCIIGLGLGLVLFILTRQWVLIPSMMVFIPLPTIFIGGNRIARLKRGKPDTWFARSINLWMAKQGFNSHKLIFNDDPFIVRRKGKVKRK